MTQIGPRPIGGSIIAQKSFIRKIEAAYEISRSERRSTFFYLFIGH